MQTELNISDKSFEKNPLSGPYSYFCIKIYWQRAQRIIANIRFTAHFISFYISSNFVFVMLLFTPLFIHKVEQSLTRAKPIH